MNEKREIRRGFYKGERPLFQARDLKIYDTIFDEGESPLKESRDTNYTAACSSGNTPCGMPKTLQ